MQNKILVNYSYNTIGVYKLLNSTFPLCSFNQSLLDLSIPRQHLEALKQGHYIKLPTYVQDVQGFLPYVKDLKTNIFKFNERLNNYSKKLYQKMIEGSTSDVTDRQVHNFTTVSIHIRLTDFGGHLKSLWNITYAQPEYFSNAMRYITERYQVSIRIIENVCKLQTHKICMNETN